MNEITTSNINTTSLQEYKDFLGKLTPKIGSNGGRYYTINENTEEETEFKLNDIVRSFETIVRNSEKSIDREEIGSIIKIIRNLDQSSYDLLEEMSLAIKIATFIRQLLGNLFFDKYKILDEIQYPNQKLATSLGNYRLLALEGEIGTVFCRIRGIAGNLIPSISDHGLVEYYLRTEPRLRNLVAVRGFEEGTRMIGPCDHFGNLENPYEYEYTIQIDNGIPVFSQHEKSSTVIKKEKNLISDLLHPPSTKLQAEWISGDITGELSTINENKLGESLFKRKGILKISGGTEFELEKFDATKVDLSSFKARLVKNDTPFQVSDKIISPEDNYRVVSYLYEKEYADRQIKEGGGLFLETHSFPQTITPLDNNSVGFVTLGKWADEKKRNELELIAVEIPFGYTLVVEEYCIHGDTNLDGMFMMCMTSSHKSMLTADTVFLKNSDNMENVSLSIKGSNISNEKLERKEKKVFTALPPITKFEN